MIKKRFAKTLFFDFKKRTALIKANSKGKKPRIKSMVVFNKGTAAKFHDLRYYEQEQDRLKNLVSREKDKSQLRTPKMD